MIRAGTLNACIRVFHRREQVSELTGETEYRYEEAKTTHAHIRPTTGRSVALPGGSEYVEVSHIVTVRTASIPALSTDTYFVYRGQRYDVLYFYPIYNRRGWMEIFCRLTIEDGAQEVQADDGRL